MNNTFYNGRLTLIAPSHIESLPTFVDLYVGTIEECYVKIKKYELENDEFYTGHVIIKDVSMVSKFKFVHIFTLAVKTNILYTTEINHSHINSECNINDSVLMCNSFVLPIVANSSRTDNNLYGDCISHRIQLKTFNDENSSLLKRSIT